MSRLICWLFGHNWTLEVTICGHLAMYCRCCHELVELR